MTRDQVAQLLERANAEGRTRIRCRHCGQPIGRGTSSGRWLDDDGYAGCRARRLPLTTGALPHEPPPAYPAP